MADHWMARPVWGGQQLDLASSQLPDVDQAGSHPGERVVPGFPLGSQVATLPNRGSAGSSGSSVGEVVGYYRGNLVVREPAHGTTVHIAPSGAELVP